MTPPRRDLSSLAPVAPLSMSAPNITQHEVDAIRAAAVSGCLSIGPHLEEFERQMAAQTGAAHAVGVSSGTAGLHLAVIAADVQADDLVITTPFSFVASANCVLYERAVPVFVDVDPVTGNIDPALVAEAVGDLTEGGEARRRWLPRALRDRRTTGTLKAILPVHAFGQPADMDPIIDVATGHGLAVIEDACEAIGAEYKGRQAGMLGDVGVFGFYPNKQLTTGEGGMLVTNRGDWAARFRSLRNQGRDLMSAWLRHDRLGYNYRLDEMSAALGHAQLSRLPELLAGREQVVDWYADGLADVPGVSIPFVASGVTRMSWFAYVVRLDPTVDRDLVMSELEVAGVPTRPYFSPIHLQPFYQERFGYVPGDFPIAEALGETCLALPFSGTMRRAEVERVCRELGAAVQKHAGRAVPVLSRSL